MEDKIKVLIVDDSSVVRQVLTEVLASHPKIEVMGSAADPYLAAQKIARKVPDVIVLDVEMPRMDGITFLHKIMSQHPIPVVICSTLTAGRTDTAMKALEYGAVEIINKPKVGTKHFLHESSVMICDAVLAASMVKLKPIKPDRWVSPKLTADAVLAMPKNMAMAETTDKVVAVGASTGVLRRCVFFCRTCPQILPA